ncbi:DEAD/DEAH box helicase [Roseomonas sp. CECT 9278]|uniref:DEAD/DEAH box helicase n=1 Tax=Roseomonas sp. CECT 9278 TaxID=2845823 RepID=UPI001E49BC92|nr:DEAD/DEAH box helicase [Roseomonas sp. CECT 9278]CAH0262103.1 ATP-dependent RNA helicase DeaD [Roseomonas sp. CECT 9278]
MTFATLPAPLLAALSGRGYAEPTPVQAAVLQPEAAGRDLLVSAQTGSGKTVAYGLALAPELIGEAPRLPPAGPPLALVVAPTRELALQVKAELTWLFAPAGGRIVSCVGGMDPVAERRLLNQGAHIVVGTPGRLRDHLERGNLAPSALRAVVLDEADEMLDLGFKEELEAILEETPAERRTLMFSATVPRGIAALAKGYQRDALRIEVASEGGQHGDIDYRAAVVAPHEIERAVVNILRLEDPRIAMVFCATRATVTRLQGNLSERGFSTVALSGELSQAERNRALQSLRDGRARVCVATDVAARGIDLPDLGVVIHAELPRDPETLLHRSGRTGRAGRKGISVLLVPHTRRGLAQRLLGAARVTATWAPAPSAEAIRARDAERLSAQAIALAAEEPAEEDVAVARLLLADPALAEGGAQALAAALVRVLRAPLPAPEELTEFSDRPAPRDRRDAMPRAAQDGARDGPPGREPGGQEGIWFRMDVGRNGNADPRWLLPFLCRRGHVTRQEIGRIRILGRETQFEVAPYAAARFAAAARRAEGDDAHIKVEPLQPLKGPPRLSRRPEAARAAADHGAGPPAPMPARGKRRP